MIDERLGALAALGTAVCWTFTALAFSAAGRRIGSMTVNVIRLVIAFALLSLWGWLFRGQPLPTDATPHAWAWLSLSGLVGFTCGDLCLFRAFVVLGPRLSSLVMSLAPPIAALIGWWLLGETLEPRRLAGIALTAVGIGWAGFEPHGPAAAVPRKSLHHPSTMGLLLALGGALGQGGGLVLSKLGMGDYDPFAATQIRVAAGFAGFALIFTVLGWWPRVSQALDDRRGLGFTGVGAFFGPFLGVSLSLLAVQRVEAGVAASIMAISPILVIPAVVLLHGERVGVAGVGGALLAVAGVSLLFR